MNPRPAAQQAALAILEALRGDDFNVSEHQWVEMVIETAIRRVLGRPDDGRTPVPHGDSPVTPTGTLTRFPAALRPAGAPADLQALAELTGPAGRRMKG